MKKLNLILTCDGGNGHKAAAESIRNNAIASNDAYHIVNTSQSRWFSGGGPNLSYKYDQYWYNGSIDLGPIAARLWNWAQRTSNAELLRIMAAMRHFSSLSIPSFRYRTYELLTNREDINSYSEVILHNTQPNCLQALVFSTARYNREVDEYNKNHPNSPRRNKVRFINHFTDMPTQQAKMFIEEIAKIDPADLDDAQFELHTRPPILNDEDTDRDLSDLETTIIYHREMKKLYPNLYKNLTAGHTRIKFVDGPIRPEFLYRKEHPAKRTDGLTIQFAKSSEYLAIKPLFQSELSDFQEDKKTATLSVNEQIEITSLMLGSQASIDGTLSLVHEEIEAASADKTKKKYLFVFCGPNQPENGLFLYEKVLNIATKLNTIPNHPLKIIPLTNQAAPFIADLYSLADKVITRPGGISIMEIEAVVKNGKIFIFTELGKLAKLTNSFLGYSTNDLKSYFSKQRSQARLSDLIAWESGNALHAQNKCKDKLGRNRVIPINAYTYRHELDFLDKKELVLMLIEEKRFNEAFQYYKDDAELSLFMLTGDDKGADLACICELLHFNKQIIQRLNHLISQNSELKKLINGPSVCLQLLEKLNREIRQRVEQNDDPSTILKHVGLEIKKINYSFLVSIDAVKDSNLQNKSYILVVLSAIAKNFINFFCLIFGLKFKTPTFDAIEDTRKYFVSNLPINVSQRLNKYEDDSAQFLITDLNDNEWVEFERILQQLFDENPDLKNQSFKISKSEFPQLQHDFLYCGPSDSHIATSYVLGRVLGQGGYGKVTLIQDRQGKTAVVKEHFSVLHDKAIQSFIHTNDIPCLEQMGMLIRSCAYHYSDSKYSSDYITIQKYIHGVSLADFVIDKKNSLFAKYKAFTEGQRLKIALALANGLKDCFDKGIIHGDITPQNILISKGTKGMLHATLIDYGLAQFKNSPELSFCPYVSPYYGAPELLTASKNYKEGTKSTFPYSEASDVYSLGIILKDFGIDPKITSKMITAASEDRMPLTDLILILSERLFGLDETPNESDIKLTVAAC